MRRTLTAMPLALVMAVSPIVVVPAGAQSPGVAPGEARTLVHDELGRLEAVIDPSQGVAVYRYDAVGNIVAIERPELTDVSIIEVTPDRGETGDAITIQGTAFGADPGSNKVTIGGVPATIDSASATTIVARIPDGATDGPVVVTTPTGTATADETLSIGSLAPVDPLGLAAPHQGGRPHHADGQRVRTRAPRCRRGRRRDARTGRSRYRCHPLRVPAAGSRLRLGLSGDPMG